MQKTKLIRDKIPDIIRAKGKEPHVHIADDVEYDQALREKLQEEVTEYLNGEHSEELADILEVIDAICVQKGFEMKDVLARKAEKREKRGGFEGKVILEM